MIKQIYSFTVHKTEEVEEKVTTTNEKGEQITVAKKLKKEVPHKFFIRKPTRSLQDDASLYFSVMVSKGIKAGLLTLPLLEKRHSEDGGLLSDVDKTRYLELFGKIYDLERDIQKLELKKTEEQTEEEKKEKRKKINELTENRSDLQRLEILRNSIYENTAEVRARNATITWWVLHLAYKDLGNDKFEPLFGDGSYDQKLLKYDELTELEDDFTNTVITKFITYVSLWASNRASTPEEFEELEKFIKSDSLLGLNIVEAQKESEKETTKESEKVEHPTTKLTT